MRFDAFNYREQFKIYRKNGQEAFINAHLNEFKEYLKVENSFFSLKGEKPFIEEELTNQLKTSRKILCKEIDSQDEQLKIMVNLGLEIVLG